MVKICCFMLIESSTDIPSAQNSNINCLSLLATMVTFGCTVKIPAMPRDLNFNLLASGLSQPLKMFGLNLLPRETLPVLHSRKTESENNRSMYEHWLSIHPALGFRQCYTFAEIPYSAKDSSWSFKWRW